VVGITLLHGSDQSATWCKWWTCDPDKVALLENDARRATSLPYCRADFQDWNWESIYHPHQNRNLVVLFSDPPDPSSPCLQWLRDHAFNLEIYGTTSVIAAHYWSIPLVRHIRDVERPRWLVPQWTNQRWQLASPPE